MRRRQLIKEGISILSAAVLASLAAGAVADSNANDAAGTASQTPLSIKQQGYFFVDQQYYTATTGEQFLANQAYVEFQIPAQLKHPYPIVFFPGGGQTGTNFMWTPDGREGWAQFFLARGYAVYIVDEVGRGKAPWSVDLYGPLPGGGRFTSTEQRLPAIVLTHSMSASYGGQIADARPALVKGLLQVEPSGPPFYDVVNIAPPVWFADSATPWRQWGITRSAMSY